MGLFGADWVFVFGTWSRTDWGVRVVVTRASGVLMGEFCLLAVLNSVSGLDFLLYRCLVLGLLFNVLTWG